LAPEGKALLQKVRDSTRQVGLLVDDLLAFAHLGRQALTKVTLDPGKIVHWCLDEMARERHGRKVEIVIGDLPACRGDAVLLKQVWTNLLSNALKYTRKQEIARIEIGSRTQPRLAADGQPSAPDDAGPELVYFVKDNGAGFDMKHIGQLFGVFQRLHTAAEYEGTGVGLAIVQRIVQRHGGRIWAEAKPNQGATFSFTLD
jgi:light-regulated signal transduction histidine kinase (bacteriophytochrome)